VETIPLGQVRFAQSVAFSFPATMCCNCGATNNLKIVNQDTRRSSYFLLAGTELTFQLPLPFCPACTATAKRRPRSVTHYALLALLVFGAAFLGLMILGDVVMNLPALTKNLMSLSVLTTALVIGLMLILSRPKGKQTSAFQPVRIKKLKREFVSGTITAIAFAFTNRAYARAFVEANPVAVRSKVVGASVC